MTYKKWVWQHQKWPRFNYDKKVLQRLGYQFFLNTRMISGVLQHIQKDSKGDLLVEILSTKALKTSEIEGGILSRENFQSSIKNNTDVKNK